MYEQLLAHLVGDYVLQTDHMADRKTKDFSVALLHAWAYAIPFMFLVDIQTVEVLGVPLPYFPPAYFVILVSHAVIDRWRLAKYVVWAKNQLAPATYRYPFAKAAWHGYQDAKPDWLAGWLFILADNILHLLINYASLRWL